MIPARLKQKVRVFAIGCISSLTVIVNTIISNIYNLTTSPQLISPVPAVIMDNTLTVAEPTPPPNTNPVECQISNSFTAEVQAWENDICRWSKEQQLDPDLIATIMQIESCGNTWAVSATGVKGLFQVTGANLSGGDGFDPNVSAAAGPGKVLKNALTAANGNVPAAMAAYNGGGWAREYIAGEINRNQFIAKLRSHRFWNTQSKALAKVNEVERYAQWANIFFEAKENRTDTLGVWLNLGGYRLCNDAAYQLGMTPRYNKPEGQAVMASDTENKE